MTDMVERVAKSIFENTYEGLDFKWENMEDSEQYEYLCNASAAIKAMREPTDEMLGSASKNSYFDRDNVEPAVGLTVDQIWQAMIDSALTE